MDLIAQALAKREQLKGDLQRIESFLQMAYELQSDQADAPQALAGSAKMVSHIRLSVGRAPTGVGAETVKVAEEIMREAGRAMATRELVPLIQAHNIEIGGKDPVATLSARLGNDAKREDWHVRLRAGKWYLREWITSEDNEEAADFPTKDTSAASLFQSNKENDAMPPP